MLVKYVNLCSLPPYTCVVWSSLKGLLAITGVLYGFCCQHMHSIL